jgi:hypothetical protein
MLKAYEDEIEINRENTWRTKDGRRIPEASCTRSTRKRFGVVSPYTEDK